MSLQGNPKLFNIVKNNRVDELQKELNGNVTTLQDTSYELDCETYFTSSLNKGLTLMHVAAFYDALDCVEYFDKQGISPEIKSALGYSPVHYAALGGAKEVLIYLCTEHNVDINSAPANGYTPICLATCNDSDEILRILFDCGAKYIQQSAGKVAINSPLLKAIEQHKTQPFVFLMERCVPMSLKDEKDYSPLMKCIAHRLYDGVNLLLQSDKVNVNYLDGEGRSALMFAIGSTRADLVQKLIDKGANVNQRGFLKQYPIHFAVTSGSYEIVEMLINAGANVNVTDKSNKLPINCLSPKPDALKILDLLIKNGNDINHYFDKGAFIANFITQPGQEEFFKYIIDHGFDFSGIAPNHKTYYELIMTVGKPQYKELVKTHYKPKK